MRTLGCIEKEEKKNPQNWLSSGPPLSEGGHWCSADVLKRRCLAEDAQDKATNSVHTLKAPSASRGTGACVGIGACTFASVFEEEEQQRARHGVADL